VLVHEPKLLELDEAVRLHTPPRSPTSSSSARSARRSTASTCTSTSGRASAGCSSRATTGLSDVDTAVERLRAQGHVFDEDDAVWVRTTDFGDDKDRVIRRRQRRLHRTSRPTPAYYLDKGDRGFGHKIYLLGADHHGYVHRLSALAGAAGDDPERDIEVLIGQLVSINGAKLSKRRGNIIELDDLQAWLGTDALRYTLARYPAGLAAHDRPRVPPAPQPTTTPSSTCSTRTRARPQLA
jgi:arginyl-tRNA synthetase